MLFTFPSRYLFTIGHYEYLALDLSRTDFLPDFSCLVVLKKKFRNCMMFRYTGLSPSMVRHSRRVLLHSTQKSFAVLLHRSNLSYYALYATPVSFKSPSCDFDNTYKVWANRYLLTDCNYSNQSINFYIYPLSLATTEGISSV